MKHTRIAAAVAAAALTLAGCSTGNAEPKKAEPQEDGAITTIEKLHQAFVDAGGTCKELSPRNVTAATDAADCDDDTVLMVFTDEKAANAHASEMTAMGSNVLVGDAFVINSELQELRKVVRSLNGVVSMATEGHEETPAAAPTPKPTPTTPPTPEKGTRDNPGMPDVDVITFSEGAQPTWEVKVGYADFDAWPEISAANRFYDPPAAGQVYVLLPVTVTYKGQGSGTPWLDVDVAFVSADGRSYDAEIMSGIPGAMTDVDDLYTGGSALGTFPFEIPADALEGGTWAVSADWSDPMFIAALPTG